MIIYQNFCKNASLGLYHPESWRSPYSCHPRRPLIQHLNSTFFTIPSLCIPVQHIAGGAVVYSTGVYCFVLRHDVDQIGVGRSKRLGCSSVRTDENNRSVFTLADGRPGCVTGGGIVYGQVRSAIDHQDGTAFINVVLKTVPHNMLVGQNQSTRDTSYGKTACSVIVEYASVDCRNCVFLLYCFINANSRCVQGERIRRCCQVDL